jgi:copper(I)-binding protein/peroxiredoxin
MSRVETPLASGPAAGRRTWLALGVVGGLLALSPLAWRSLRARRPEGGIDLHAAPRAVPVLHFADGEGRSLTLDDFRGRVVLLNVWATWCTPCREEMPTLDRLQGVLGGPDFEVLALSIDARGLEVVQPFYKGIGLEHLRMYLDTAGAAMSTLGIPAIPLTLLIDRDGREIGRKFGAAVWDSPAMVGLLRSRLAPAVGAANVPDPATSVLTASEAWARPTLPGQDVAAVYLTLTSARGATLVGVRSDAAQSVQVHDMTMDGDVMKMRERARLPLPAGKAVRLQPGGTHLMMLRMNRPLKTGDQVTLNVSLVDRDGAETVVRVDVPVRTAAPGGS